MKTINKDKAIAACCMVLGIVYLAAALQLPATNLVNDPGPKVFPLIGGVIVIASSLAILLKRYDEAPKATYTKAQWKKAAVMFGVFVLYAVMLWIFGYVIATPIVLLLTSYMFTDEGVKVALWKRILFAAAVTAFIYWIFVKVLVMLLPTGIIF